MMSVWILTHGDSDGICSGALALAANPEARVFFTSPVELAQDLKRVDLGSSLIVCDIALASDTLSEVSARMGAPPSKNTMLYVDHHPLPLNFNTASFPAKFIHELGPCASELTYNAFQDRLERKMSRVAIYGAIGDYADDTPFVRESLRLGQEDHLL